MRIRTRAASGPLLLVSLALAGCGGGSDDDGAAPATVAKQARIPAAVAERLAGRADTIAARLASGDVCGAAQEADSLRAEAIGAVNAREVPAAWQEDLLARANELVDAVNCPPPAAVQEEPDDGEGDETPGKGKKKGKKH